MTSLLQAGRYRHGARSIAAVVDLRSHLENKAAFAWEDLPEDHLLGLHIDRGPLDAKLIGGSIAFSGYDEKAEVDLWCEVARELWNNGATLSYAGRWASGTARLADEVSRGGVARAGSRAERGRGRRSKPDPWLESFLDDVKYEHELSRRRRSLRQTVIAWA